MKTKKLIIFGTGDVAVIANYYFEIDSDYEVCAFTADREYCLTDFVENKPLIPFDNIKSNFPVDEYEMFIALSYTQMNRLRELKFNEAIAMGYSLASYISSKCTYLSQYKPGLNSFIFENNTIQPFVQIGDNVVIWSGNHIGHHSVIYSHNFISSHVVISGHCLIKSYCFLGVNSTIAHKVCIAEANVIGAGSVILKDTLPKEVFVPARSLKLDKSSDEIVV